MNVGKDFVLRRTNKHVLFLLISIITMLFINIFICYTKSYADSAITIASVTPNSGSIIGGDTVTIVGSGFNSSDVVKFGNYQTYAINLSADRTTMVVVTPASASKGAVDVTITDSLNQKTIYPGGFTYVDSPTVTSLDPISGPVSGGQTVTVSGAGFYQNIKFSQLLNNKEWSNTACGISTGKVYCWGQITTAN